jgi:hypothetical protein
MSPKVPMYWTPGSQYVVLLESAGIFGRRSLVERSCIIGSVSLKVILESQPLPSLLLHYHEVNRPPPTCIPAMMYHATNPKQQGQETMDWNLWSHGQNTPFLLLSWLSWELCPSDRKRIDRRSQGHDHFKYFRLRLPNCFSRKAMPIHTLTGMYETTYFQ